LDTQPVTPAAAPATGTEPDLAYGAYQRGYYLSAANHATRRVAWGDAKAMTLLGELCANGFGVVQDDNKAAEWYGLAAERGDREAMFALAMFRMGGRGGAQNREEAARLLAAAAKLGHVAAAYNLGLLYLEGRLFPQDFKRAAELFHMAAEAGSPEAQYALGTFYKEGRGVMQNYVEAARWLGAAAAADYTDAQVEYAIALFNGTGVEKNESGAVALLSRAARKGSPIAQNRLAHVYAAGRVLAADPVAAIKWHLISKASGAKDLVLDEFMSKQRSDVRAAAEKAARPWVEVITQSRS
jgi:TPR repeat protein